MPTGRQVESVVRRFDRALLQLEAEAITALRSALSASARELEDELARLYRRARAGTASVGAPIREAQARLLLEQVRAMNLTLNLGRNLPIETVLAQLQAGAANAGAANALAMLSLHGQAVAGLAGGVNVGAVAAATRVSARLQDIGAARVANGTARLLQHTEAAARAIEQHIISGITTGRGWTSTASAIRKDVRLLNHEAERLVRTESVTAADSSRRDQYRQHGVEHVRVLATMDDRVCGYCALRSGRIYSVDEIELPFHPNCRCTTVPVRPDWVAAGIDDPDWYDEHHAATVAKAREQGHKIHTGPAPSERWRGRESAPQAIPYDEFKRMRPRELVA